jgi:hypothetical protein
MTQQTSSDSNTDTTGCGKDPAPQPDPRDPTKDCSKPPYSKQPPELTPPPEECKTCCTCPPVPKPDEGCLDKLIRKEATTAALGEEAKKSKSEFEGFLAKLKTATEKYTPEKYSELVKRWQENDTLLAGLIHKLVCNIPCWYCVIECEICPLINAIAADERELKGTDQLYTTANSLYDQRYWLWRELQIRQDAFDRVNKVMIAWQDPFTTIDTLLKTVNTDGNAASSGKMLGPELNKLLYDVFFRLVPLHLAIAPPTAVATTAIQKKFVELCPCDKPGEADDCCGPNVGPLSVRERLVGPQPYLIAPEAFPDLVCCLASNAYQPAKAALAAASAAFAGIDAQIEAKKVSIAARLKSLPADAKLRLGKAIECKDYKSTTGGSNGGGNNGGGSNGGGGKCCDDDQGSATPTNRTTAS